MYDREIKREKVQMKPSTNFGSKFIRAVMTRNTIIGVKLFRTHQSSDKLTRLEPNVAAAYSAIPKQE